jgi:hypothetical protein
MGVSRLVEEPPQLQRRSFAKQLLSPLIARVKHPRGESQLLMGTLMCLTLGIEIYHHLPNLWYLLLIVWLFISEGVKLIQKSDKKDETK